MTMPAAAILASNSFIASWFCFASISSLSSGGLNITSNSALSAGDLPVVRVK